MFLFRHFETGLEDVDAIAGAADDHLEVDGVVAQLLNLFLTLMDEHEFVGELGVFLFVLHRHVPDGNRVVLACNSHHGLLLGLESNRSDGLAVPVEA